MSDSLIQLTLKQMQAAGFDRTQITLTYDEQQELNIENGKINLLRSGQDQELSITGILKHREASLSITNLDENSINSAIANLVEMAEGSEPDEAYDIAPLQESASFSSGSEQADLDKMYDCLSEFLVHLKANHPKIIMSECSLDFTRSTTRLVNSHGVDFTETSGAYNGGMLFSAKDDKNTSSFNYTGFSAFELDKPMAEYGTIENLLQSTSDSLEAKAIPGKFVGEIIITPDAINDFIGFLSDSVHSMPMIAGTSLYKGKLGEQVASEKLTLKNLPLDPEMPGGYSFTGDGFKAENNTLIENGVLNTYLLSQYGARKTGLERAVNQGGCTVMETGDQTLEEMIASVDEGIILGRFSGGQPADKGDFSGIAKNSVYVKNGKVQYALSETMISGNMAKVLNDIESISRESVDFGDSRLSWMKVSGITLS